MSAYTIAIIATLIVNLAFGISNALWKTPVKVLNPALTIFYRNFFTTLFLGVWALVANEKFSNDYLDWVYGVIICIISFYGLYFFNCAHQTGNVSEIVPIINLNGLVMPFFLAVFYLGENLNAYKIFIYLLVLIGISIIQDWQLNKLKWYKKTDLGIYYALLAMLFWGVSYPLFIIPIRKLGVANFSVLLEFTILIMSTLHLIWAKTSIIQPITKLKIAFPYIIAIAICGSIGVYFINLIFYHIEVTAALIIGSIGHLTPLLIARFYFQEKVSFRKYLGIGLIITAILLFQIIP